jgi:acyl carrier protein
MPLSEAEIDLKIRAFLKDNFYIDTLTPPLLDTDSFLEKGVIDSTGVLEVINFIQNEFGFEVLDSEILPENIDSIKNISSYILKKKIDKN